MTVAPQRDNIISTHEFLEVSDFILAQNWEGNGPEIGVYGLSSVVYKGGFPTHLSNRQMKQYKAVSKFRNPYKHCSGKCLTFHIFILLSGDIATNPGPIRFPCGSCAKPVHDYDMWSHRTCLSMTKEEYIRLSNSDDFWYCNKCILPNFTDSFFSADSLSDTSFSSDISSARTETLQLLSLVKSPGFLIQSENLNTSTNSESDDSCDIFKELRDTRKGNLKKPILCHLNINSLRHKFNDLKPILMDKLCDILIVSETKLDDTFNDNLFHVNGYKMERKDRNAKGGGLLVKPSICPLNLVYVMKLRITIEKLSICMLNLVYVQ